MDILIQHHLGDTSDEVLLREAIDAKSFLSVFSIAKEKQCFTYQGVSQETRPWQPVSATRLAIEREIWQILHDMRYLPKLIAEQRAFQKMVSLQSVRFHSLLPTQTCLGNHD